MAFYTYDHIHLLSQEPMETARYFNEMFGARIVESVQSDGNPRVDLDLNGLEIFIARCSADTIPSADHPHQGLDHFGLRVENLEEAAAELRAKGVEFTTEPYDLRPGVRIAFVVAPGNIRIELLEKGPQPGWFVTDKDRLYLLHWPVRIELRIRPLAGCFVDQRIGGAGIGMQDRLNNLEILMEMYASVAEQIATSQQRMRENHLRIAENQRQIAENLLRIDENVNFLEESQGRINELLQQVLSAVALMQADIVRIDETHSQ